MLCGDYFDRQLLISSEGPPDASEVQAALIKLGRTVPKALIATKFNLCLLSVPGKQAPLLAMNCKEHPVP